MKNFQENLIQDTTNPEKIEKGFCVEIPADEARKITDELSKINDLISHDGIIKIDDLDNLSSVAKETKIDIDGELMTVEEAENNPDIKMNVKIWKEMEEGNFENISSLTRITPKVSKYLEKIKGQGFILLWNLTSAKGLVLPENIQGDLHLNSLTSAEGLDLPVSIGGNLCLDGLITDKGLVLPTHIGGGLLLGGLTSVSNLILPWDIKGEIHLNRLSEDEKEKLRMRYPQYADKIK